VINVPEASTAQGTLKRLIEAEERAREILKAAEERAQQTVEQAREEAARSVDTVRRESAGVLQARLQEAESKGAAERKQRLDQADAKAGEFERRAQEHMAEAVRVVTDWVINGGDST